MSEIRRHKVTVIPGDGIGPEIVGVVRRIVDASGAPVEWKEAQAGLNAFEDEGELLPEKTLKSIEETGLCLKGPITTPIGHGFRSMNVTLRKHFDLYANVRPVRSIEGIPARFSNVDLTIFRENTEDLYAGVEEKISSDEMHSIKVITRRASERIARRAYEYARAQKTLREKNASAKRTSVTIVTKANIMKLTDGLFLDVCRGVAVEYPDIETREVLVDAMCMQLVIHPERYDILLTENLYGDILSDLCAGLAGGLGLVPGSNLGENAAIYEAVHGSAPDIAGQGIANPTALLQSACMMLEHIGEDVAAEKIRRALFSVLKHEELRTPDIGGTGTTERFEKSVLKEMEHVAGGMG